MCGIVGYKGKKQAAPILFDSLKRLEYRGYDSSGIGIWEKGNIKVLRKKGKVDELKDLLNFTELQGSMGIAHTRWATHGLPSDENAHPHMAYGVCVVHNGIIENYLEIKNRLRKRGHEFLSDTDTEVIPHLVAFYMRQGKGFISSVCETLKELQGSYAVVIMNEKENTLIGAKKESPLVVGFSEDEFFIASDIPALIDKTRDFIFLEDGDLVVINDEIKLFDLDGNPVERKPQRISWTPSMAEKGGFKHFMLKEIYEQPRAISDTMMGRINEERGKISFEDFDIKEDIERMWMVACGTSFHAALIGKYIFESMLKIPVEVDIASEFRYRDPIIREKELLILISQSGETADTIAALREGKKKGARTLSICNVLGSTISRESDYVIYTHAGPEIGVASTKAFVTQIVTLFMLALYIGDKKGIMNTEIRSNYIGELKKIPRLVKKILDEAKIIEEISERYTRYKDFLFLGRGINYPTALEGALKLKEISYIHAEAYPAGEMKHGPIALIDEDMPVLFVSPFDKTYKKTISNMEEVVARKGIIILLTDGLDHAMAKKAKDTIIVPKTVEELQPVTSIIPLQLLAYYIANFLGKDVDQPRNLAKSVTVE